MQHDQKQNVAELFQGTRGTVSKESTSTCFPLEWKRHKKLGKTILYLLLQCVKAIFLVKTMHYFVKESLRSSGHAYFAGQEYK